MFEHECKQEEKIDKLIAITTKIDQAICGNGVPGLHQRVTAIETGYAKLLTVSAAIGAGCGTVFGVLVTIIKG